MTKKLQALLAKLKKVDARRDKVRNEIMALVSEHYGCHSRF
jgi:hypothetical protein